MKTIDCLGEICPVPIIKLQNSLKEIQKGETFMMVSDHSCTLTSVKDFCKNHHLSMTYTEAINGVWEIIISR